MRISVFWGHEHLTDRSISKRYLKSHITTWVEKSWTSRAIHARDTGFYWSSENALHERFITSSGIGVWMKMLQVIAKRWKNVSVQVWIQLYSVLDYRKQASACLVFYHLLTLVVASLVHLAQLEQLEPVQWVLLHNLALKTWKQTKVLTITTSFNVIHIQIPSTTYVDLIWCRTAVATASWSTSEGTLRVLCSYYDRSCILPSMLLQHCSSHSSTASYKTYIASQKEFGCSLKQVFSKGDPHTKYSTQNTVHQLFIFGPWSALNYK